MLSKVRIKTEKRQEIVDLTQQIKKIIEKRNVKEGLCVIYTGHATCSIIINENYDKAVCDDIINVLNKLVPEHAGYKHDAIDNNAHAHIKSSIIGPSQIIPIADGKLQLGRWQGIALAEFDGPREREIIVKVIKG